MSDGASWIITLAEEKDETSRLFVNTVYCAQRFDTACWLLSGWVSASSAPLSTVKLWHLSCPQATQAPVAFSLGPGTRDIGSLHFAHGFINGLLTLYFGWHTLPETENRPSRIGKDRIPSIIFQVLLMLVSGRVIFQLTSSVSGLYKTPPDWWLGSWPAFLNAKNW